MICDYRIKHKITGKPAKDWVYFYKIGKMLNEGKQINCRARIKKVATTIYEAKKNGESDDECQKWLLSCIYDDLKLRNTLEEKKDRHEWNAF